MGNLLSKDDDTAAKIRGKGKKNGIALLVAIGLLFFLVYYILHHTQDFTQLAAISFSHIPTIIIAAGLFLLLIGMNGFLLNSLLPLFHTKLPIQEWWGLALVNNFYNLITPFRGGLAIQALYLKKKHALPYTHYLAINGALLFFTVFTASITALFCLPFIGSHLGKAQVPFFLLALGGVLLQVLVLAFTPRIRTREGKWVQRLIHIHDGWVAIKGDKKKVAMIVVVNLMQRFLKALFLVLVYSCVGVPLNFNAALFISSVGIFSLVITILPGNLGLDDAINVFSASIVGVHLHGAIAATLLARMINLAISLTLGPYCSYRIMKG